MQGTKTLNNSQVAPVVHETKEGEGAELEGENRGVSETQSQTVSPDLKDPIALTMRGLWGPCSGDAMNSDPSAEERKEEVLAWQSSWASGGVGGGRRLPLSFFTSCSRGVSPGLCSDWVQPLFEMMLL